MSITTCDRNNDEVFGKRKQMISEDYLNFLNFFNAQKENFTKISTSQATDFSELFNFINGIFTENSHDHVNGNTLLKLLNDQNKFIEDLYAFINQPTQENILTFSNQRNSYNPHKGSFNPEDKEENKREIQLEMQSKLIEKYLDKIQEQEARLSLMENENKNIRFHLEKLLRKTLLRNLPHHFGKSGNTSVGGITSNYYSSSSNYTSHLNVTNYHNLHTSFTHTGMNFQTRGNLHHSASSNTLKSLDMTMMSPKKNLNEIKPAPENEIVASKEKRVTLKINEYIENIAGKESKKKVKFARRYNNNSFDNEVDNLINQIKTQEEFYRSEGIQNTSDDKPITNLGYSNSGTNMVVPLDTIPQSNGIYSEETERNIPQPMKSERPNKPYLYNTNIISSKGIKDYIKSVKEKNEEDYNINHPTKKFVRRGDSIKNNQNLSNSGRNFSAIKVNSSSANGNSSTNKKTLQINKNRDLIRSNYGKNVALIRENANRIINFDVDAEVNIGESNSNDTPNNETVEINGVSGNRRQPSSSSTVNNGKSKFSTLENKLPFHPNSHFQGTARHKKNKSSDSSHVNSVSKGSPTKKRK